MKLVNSTLLSLSFLGLAAAQDYPLQTEPFYLKLQSDSEAWDGQYLASYHSGAAIEQLSPAGTEKPTVSTREYFLNHTDCAPEVKGNKVGILTWNLPYNDGFLASSGLQFSQNDTSDVTMMIFMPGPPPEGTPPLGFDEQDKMFVYVDAGEENGSEAYEEWFVCSTYFGGYNYNALTWIHGASMGASVHPSCHAVDVLREFVDA